MGWDSPIPVMVDVVAWEIKATRGMALLRRIIRVLLDHLGFLARTRAVLTSRIVPSMEMNSPQRASDGTLWWMRRAKRSAGEVEGVALGLLGAQKFCNI